MKNLLLFFTALLLVSCGPTPSTQDLKLNNGEKWEINAEMTPHIAIGMKILDDYVANSGTDYHTLADQLEKQNWQLIRNCTMEGPSHDQLHNWLHPHMALIDELEDAENLEDATVKVEELVASFEIYKAHFR